MDVPELGFSSFR
jgi:hypothetical protein